MKKLPYPTISPLHHSMILKDLFLPFHPCEPYNSQDRASSQYTLIMSQLVLGSWILVKHKIVGINDKQVLPVCEQLNIIICLGLLMKRGRTRVELYIQLKHDLLHEQCIQVFSVCKTLVRYWYNSCIAPVLHGVKCMSFMWLVWNLFNVTVGQI